MAVGVEVRGLDRLVRKLDRVAGTAAIKRAMGKSVRYIRSEVADYPGPSAANIPPGVRGDGFYIRGTGWQSVRRDGSYGRLYMTSERLGQSWTTRVSNDGLRGHIMNNASYAEFVQGRQRQTAFHKRRGWTTVEDTIDDRRDRILRFFQDEIEAAMSAP